ncbi:hypothetical protein D3C87_1806690 [compost metagenome]
MFHFVGSAVFIRLHRKIDIFGRITELAIRHAHIELVGLRRKYYRRVLCLDIHILRRMCQLIDFEIARIVEFNLAGAADRPDFSP